MTAERANINLQMEREMQRRERQMNTTLMHQTQQCTESMAQISRELRFLAEKTASEAVTMRIITIVTFVFLPGTFCSVSSEAANVE